MSGSCVLAIITAKGFSPQRLAETLRGFATPSRYCVAYSGGLDSHVLLHALAELRSDLPATEVHAVYIDHGLQIASRQWAEHCGAICAALHVPFQAIAVEARAAHGASPEAAARAARYQALAALLEPGDSLLTAHHQDDQAETLLLQLLRGAGPQGLAAMPCCASLGQGVHVRPLLGFTRAELHDYARRRQLIWIEDVSNADAAFERNYLRVEIMPRLRARWPAMCATLARSAKHAARAAHLLDVSANIDIQETLGSTEDTLSVTRLLTLDAARQHNVVRGWIKHLGLPTPNAVHIERIMEDVVTSAWDATPCVRWPGTEVRRYRDLIYAMPPLPPHDPRQRMSWDMSGALILSSGERLSAIRVPGAGLDAELCQIRSVTVRYRQGGEYCRPLSRGHRHELRKLFQEAGIPPWERDRLPLIYLDDQLAAVAGLWVCEPFQAGAGKPGLLVRREASPYNAHHPSFFEE